MLGALDATQSLTPRFTEEEGSRLTLVSAGLALGIAVPKGGRTGGANGAVMEQKAQRGKER